MTQDIKYRNLWDASRGVMFFATPHFGLSKENWRLFAYKVLLRHAPSEGVKPTANMLEELRVNSEMLKHVSTDFKPLQPDLSLVTFIENTPLDGMEEVVCFPDPHFVSHDKSPGLMTTSWWTTSMDTPMRPPSPVCHYLGITSDSASFEATRTIRASLAS
jgi:hypothetical protein